MSSNASGSADAEIDSCYFCDGGAGVLEEHHIIPRRFDGSDRDENLVDLCPTCHEKLERLYDKRFYDELGVEKEEEDDSVELGTCQCGDCLSDAEYDIGGWNDNRMKVCSAHKECAYDECDRRSVSTIPFNYGTILLCKEHRTCTHEGCESEHTRVVREPSSMGEKYNKHITYCWNPGGEDHIPEDTKYTTYEVFWE